MNKEFKHLLLKIATLPLSDQKWLLRQLTSQQAKQFKQQEGYSLLKQARRFCKLSPPEIPQITKANLLPELCHELNQHDSLYIAIILEQGQFEWEQKYLQSNERRDEIHQLNQKVIGRIKPATKLCVFKQWQTQLDFNGHLESIHG